MVTKGVDCGVRKRASHEVEGEIEVGKGEESEEQLDELVNEFNV